MTAFEQYQAGVRASDRFWCESDLYWRANRWEFQPMKAGQLTIIAAGKNVGRSTFGNEAPGCREAVCT